MFIQGKLNTNTVNLKTRYRAIGAVLCPMPPLSSAGGHGVPHAGLVQYMRPAAPCPRPGSGVRRGGPLALAHAWRPCVGASRRRRDGRRSLNCEPEVAPVEESPLFFEGHPDRLGLVTVHGGSATGLSPLRDGKGGKEE
ncbi:hypothetical protein EAI_07952 [Harpegnathos saltator]|uniref:Uncharacterized protein n=1 Tax=Harpegnathos saltator TaxID=610380 RepID=E2BXQ1_HARSA|nr:hypothetical protein EAI_07952 [Harpegnathos saltator]